MKVKATIEYKGVFRRPGSHDYKITKIQGAPTIEILGEDAQPQVARIGDLLTEKQAAELAERIEVTTIARAKV